MITYYSKGIVLEQNKEPALSRELAAFLDPAIPLAYLNRPPAKETRLSPEELIALAKEAGIIDETDGKPLAEKLETARYNKVHTLVADSIDDEPYISSQLCPTFQLTEQLTGGLELAQKAIGAENVSIAIYRDIYNVGIKIPEKLGEIPIERISGTYPAEYRSKKIYRNRSTAVIGSCALIHLYRAVYENRRQTTCFVTVAGDCVATPCNLEASVGMTVQQLLDHCGLSYEPKRVVVGGSMTGYAITDTKATKITPMTRGIVAFREDFDEMNYTCIGCGRCAQVCPEGLSPYYIYKFVSSRRYSMLKGFDIDLCIGCGTCSYVCPAKLDISNVIMRGKQELENYQKDRLNRKRKSSPQ